MKFAANQSMAEATSLSKFCRSLAISVSHAKGVVSSAILQTSVLTNSKNKSFRFMLKIFGPKMLPWAAPQRTRDSAEG